MQTARSARSIARSAFACDSDIQRSQQPEVFTSVDGAGPLTAGNAENSMRHWQPVVASAPLFPRFAPRAPQPVAGFADGAAVLPRVVPALPSRRRACRHTL